jgi:CheY-like chemotaxis protein
MTVILNLAIVARDAMPEGGKLVFATRSCDTEESNACVDGMAAAAQHVVITVGAAGYGSPAGRKVGLFADLCMAQDFSERSDGHVSVRRGPGCGTSVEIHLPKAARLPAQESSEPAIAGGNEAILIVEDDALVRRYVVSQIQGLGYKTFVARDASEALTIIDGGEKIDLLLTDVIMPGPISGRQLAIEAVNRRPSLRVLYTSGYSKSAMLVNGFADAGVLLLAKPYRRADLAKMIRTALAV